MFKQFLIGLKQNLREEDNLSTRDKWPVPKVSSVRRFYCKSGGSLGNEAIICELFVIFQVDFWSLEWLCLSVSLARDRSFMETLWWPLDGEWVEGEEGEGGGGGGGG